MRKPVSIVSLLVLALGLMGAGWAKPAHKAPGMTAGVHQPGMGKKAEKLGTSVVNINTASVADLQKVPGIGKTRAAKIVKMRPFASVDDLVAKKILSAKELGKVRANLSVK